MGAGKPERVATFFWFPVARNGGCVVREVYRDVDVRAAEREVERLERAAKTGEGLLDSCRATTAALFQHTLDALGTVRRLQQVLGHNGHRPLVLESAHI